MSVFATLRRKRDRSKGAAHGTVLVSESKSEPIFNSTPNLHKINPGGKHHTGLLPKGKESTAVFYPDEVDDIIEEDDCGSSYGGFGSRRSSSTVADTGTNGGHEGGRKQSLTKGKRSAGSLRNFASVISMFGSMKRTKSKSKMAFFGSSQVGL